MKNSLDITVAIPTLGRLELLSDCLYSLKNGNAYPKEILILDQSRTDDIVVLSKKFSKLPIRVVACNARGIARNMNMAFHECQTRHLLITHDDCTVAEDWVAEGVKALGSRPDHMISGRVLPGGNDPKAVPSTITWKERHEFTGTRAHGALYPNNMGVVVASALALGGFDERNGFQTAAEDLDFSYRWLKSGRSLTYEPSMSVTHNDWRDPEQLVKLYKHYARCAGRYYGKHLYERDYVPLKQGMRDMLKGIKAWLQRIPKRTPRHHDQRLELPVWVPIGIIEGWRESWHLNQSS